MVLVIANSPGPTPVALSYARAVNHERLRAAIAGLAARTGSPVSGLVIEDKPLETKSQVASTAAEFLAEGLAPPNGAPLPVQPFLEALPDWTHLRLVFVVGKGFIFAGPEADLGAGFAVQLIKGADVYQYDVVRMTGKPSAPVESSKSAQRPTSRRPLWGAAAAGLMAVLVAAVWLLVARGRVTHRPQRAQQAGDKESSPES